MDHQEFYENVCKPNNDRLESKVDKIYTLLAGENIDKPGLIDEVRSIKKVFIDNPTMVEDFKKFKSIYRCTVGALIFLVTVTVVQLFIWIRSKLGG